MKIEMVAIALRLEFFIDHCKLYHVVAYHLQDIRRNCFRKAPDRGVYTKIVPHRKVYIALVYQNEILRNFTDIS